MVLMLSNSDVDQVLTMKDTIDALDVVYGELGRGESVTFPRQDLHVPLANEQNDLAAHYLKTMGGASPAFKVAALRFSSDVCTWPLFGNLRRRVKLPVQNGKWLGLILLFSSITGELLAIIQDGYLSRMRVGGTNGLAARHLARKDAARVGIFGSGWQAVTQLTALAEVRDIQHIKVFSPTRENRARFSKEMETLLEIPVQSADSPNDAAEDVDIIVTATNSRQPFLPARLLSEGVHLSCLQRSEIEMEAYRRCDVLFINLNSPEHNYTSTLFSKREQELNMEVRDHPWTYDKFDWGSYPTLGQLVNGIVPGRTDDKQITAFINNIGVAAQFAAVGAKVFELASAQDLGQKLDSEMFLEDVHP
ncbi:MAG: ornithine cyclodeaminase family protein [Desulfobacterales bacterium]|nr:ornithine cyclodeaminase family protein [Desulfobacterales bacterium]